LGTVKLNNVVKCLIAFDTSIVAVSGLVAPVFAVFVVNNIVEGCAAVVGFATFIYMVSFSIARLTSAYYVDRELSERERVGRFSVDGSSSSFMSTRFAAPNHVPLNGSRIHRPQLRERIRPSRPEASSSSLHRRRLHGSPLA